MNEGMPGSVPDRDITREGSADVQSDDARMSDASEK